MTTIMGLDLSTTAAGVALIDYDTGDIVDTWEIVPSRKLNTSQRSRIIGRDVAELVRRHEPADIWKEAVGTRQINTAIAMGRVHQAVDDHLMPRFRTQFGEVSPTEVKQLATGKGNAKKAEMIAAAELRWPGRQWTDNTADASWVADYGRARLLAAAAGLEEGA